MSNASAMPAGVAVAIQDMLDFGEVQAGKEVLILAQIDGLYGGDNLVDEQAIAWIQAAVQQRGANPSVLWFDEPAKLHEWRIPPVVKGALKACDIVINHSFDLVIEELLEFRKLMHDEGFIMLRNFATTAPLLCTPWAQTPSELLAEIRYQASTMFKVGAKWELTDDLGTHLEGVVAPSANPVYPDITLRRKEASPYRPWPEWVFPQIEVSQASGVFVFDRTLSWWSRYMKVPAFFKEPVRLTVDACRITKIEGGAEATALKSFLKEMSGPLGDEVYNLGAMHCGVHPNAKVEPHQCPSSEYRRLIEHCHSSNLHVHIGTPKPKPDYFYFLHCTGDTRTATWRVGDTLILDKGHLTALDHPTVRAIAAKYPGRPGV